MSAILHTHTHTHMWVCVHVCMYAYIFGTYSTPGTYYSIMQGVGRQTRKTDKRTIM